MSKNFKEKMFAKLAEQKQDYIQSHINTYEEYPKCYMGDLDIDTVFAIRRILEIKILNIQKSIPNTGMIVDANDGEKMEISFLRGHQCGLLNIVEHLDQFVEYQVTAAENQLGEPMSY
jgi:hypothetical protein